MREDERREENRERKRERKRERERPVRLISSLQQIVKENTNVDMTHSYECCRSLQSVAVCCSVLQKETCKAHQLLATKRQ